ncbi:sulfotransferase family protein [Rubrivirga marina]|uniref:Sulfotransferase family protein n=2 Tax=Rubrivirga marina TaxID=1196024 RepID=A0A271J3T0_9BACT|nr:sulfotransferase family protein [Rubrivirga marina]
MWSGPRNLSTALLRSWGSRPDAAVVDEPLYAAYLAATGLDHPGRDAVLASQPTEWQDVAATLSGPVPGAARIWYQKHMAHHLLPHVGREWLDHPSFRHAFLIRDPAAMVVSLDRVTPGPTLADTGLPQQVELFDRMAQRDGAAPPVIDAADVLRDPERLLRALCARLGVPFDPAMLSWAPGPRATDGVWAEHWYASVEASTGFAPPRPEAVEVPDRLAPLVADCQPLYDTLADHRLP